MKKNLFKEISLMNIFLCFCVVMIHLTSSPLMSLRYASFAHIIIFIINKMLCFCVPSFIFLSGFKLYSKYGENKIELKKFYTQRFKKIVIPYIISVLIYFIYFWSKRWVSINDLPEYIFLGTLAAHFYYVVIAVQLYLLFPFFKGIMSRYSKAVIAVSLICTILFQEFFHFNYSDRFFGSYIFYFSLGMLFAKCSFREKLGKFHLITLMGFVIFAIIHLSLTYMAMSGKIVYRCANIINIVYVSFSILAIYGFCIKITEKYKAPYKISQVFSRISYNIYLYHTLAIFILQYDIFPRLNLSVSEKFAISFVIVYFLIFAYALLKKIKNKGLDTA